MSDELRVSIPFASVSLSGHLAASGVGIRAAAAFRRHLADSRVRPVGAGGTA